jgi:hypothetical protein
VRKARLQQAIVVRRVFADQSEPNGAHSMGGKASG